MEQQDRAMLANQEIINREQEHRRRERLVHLSSFEERQSRIRPIPDLRAMQKQALSEQKEQGEFLASREPPRHSVSDALLEQIQQHERERSLLRAGAWEEQARLQELGQLEQRRREQGRLAQQQQRQAYRRTLDEQLRLRRGGVDMTELERDLNRVEYYRLSPTGHHPILNPIDKQYKNPIIDRQMSRAYEQ
jgi:hypothetical protein